MTLPSPPLAANVDLQDFKFMPIEITRLFGSAFHAKSNDTAWRAGITLWLRSYHQVPAASLPDDDEELTRLAELGRDIRTWRKIRAMALRGWMKCSDGRLYHKVVAEKALEAWIEKVVQRKVSSAGNAKRYKQDFDPAPYDADLDRARNDLGAINPQSRMLARKGGKYASGSPIGNAIGSRTEHETPPNGSESDGVGSPKIREGKGREENESKSLKLEYLSPDGRVTDRAYELFSQSFPGDPTEEDGVKRELARRLSQGVDLLEICDGAKRHSIKCAHRPVDYIGSPVRWLVDGRWKDGKPKTDRTLPIVALGTPPGDAWAAHLGPLAVWTNGRRTVPTQWPPGSEVAA